MLLSEPIRELEDADDYDSTCRHLCQVQILKLAVLRLLRYLLLRDEAAMDNDAGEDPGEAQCHLEHDNDPLWLRYVIDNISNHYQTKYERRLEEDLDATERRIVDSHAALDKADRVELGHSYDQNERLPATLPQPLSLESLFFLGSHLLRRVFALSRRSPPRVHALLSPLCFVLDELVGSSHLI